ncbi:alpha- and gamma-adaptin-binding protein p34-like isoform X2 [Macrobrachium nipponense]|uniref:alpha- and gamma-adaptin-binding protein p34-like isoform X2 n=1 Tax=Macrobrachium nipponense TaxID=159736 RepID=UPI0030C87952
MEDWPSLVILTLHSKKGEDIVKGILDVVDVPAPSVVESKFHSWPWKIKNKYYTADIHISCVECLESHKERVLTTCEALIVYCDSHEATSLENLNSLLESLGGFEPEVQMLVCDTCSADDDSLGLSRLKAQQWCISNRWELIELNKIEEEDSGHEDDFPESWGFQRIRQALHAHTWSNLEMKEDGLNSSTLEEYFDTGDGDFEKLFSSFEQMKRTAASLPLEHRRDYAEKVAISFWKAIGGPEDELDGLDSD